MPPIRTELLGAALACCFISGFSTAAGADDRPNCRHHRQPGCTFAGFGVAPTPTAQNPDCARDWQGKCRASAGPGTGGSNSTIYPVPGK
jgi:hypothetical protein